tara:strand:+ start:47428 stop:48531 length:1104 start_codon:yes stop_codon:yes gene_type:complete
MKLRTISIIEPIGGHGGMDYYDYGLAYGLGQDNSKVYYFTSNKTKIRAFKNVVVIPIFGNLWEAKGIKRGILFLKGYFNAFLNSKKLKTDIFHFHFFSLGPLNLMVLLIAFFFKQKKVVTLHDVSPFHGSANGIIERFCFRLIDGLIVHNKTSKEELVTKQITLPNIHIIPHGNYSPFVNEMPLPKQNEIIKLLFFGQIKEVKGLDVLLKAMGKVVQKSNKFHLTIAGRPWKTGTEKYEALIDDLALKSFVNCQFDYIKDNEVESLYNNADVVILPYRKIYQSGVLLLSLSYGRTVITSDLPPFKEIITHNETGCIFSSENVDELAECILKLDREMIERLTQNSKELIKEYDWSEIGRKTKVYYGSL